MASQEMILMLELLDRVQRNQRQGARMPEEVGTLTAQELEVLQSIAQRDNQMGALFQGVLNILALPKEHADSAQRLSDLAALLMAWSLESARPHTQHRWQRGDKVRVRIPGRPLRYLATIIDEHRVFVPMLNSDFKIEDVHIFETILLEPPKPIEVAEFQQQLDGQLKSIMSQFS